MDWNRDVDVPRIYDAVARRLCPYRAPRRPAHHQTRDEVNTRRRATYARGAEHAAVERRRREQERERERDTRAHASWLLRRHPTARLLLALDPRLSDEQLERGIERARARCLAGLRGYAPSARRAA